MQFSPVQSVKHSQGSAQELPGMRICDTGSPASGGEAVRVRYQLLCWHGVKCSGQALPPLGLSCSRSASAVTAASRRRIPGFRNWAFPHLGPPASLVWETGSSHRSGPPQTPAFPFEMEVSEQGLECPLILWRLRPWIDTSPKPPQEAWPTCKKEYELYFSIYNPFLHQKLKEWKQSGKMSPVHLSKCSCVNRCPPFPITKPTHSSMTQLMHKHDKPTGSKTIVLFPSDIITSAR